MEERGREGEREREREREGERERIKVKCIVKKYYRIVENYRGIQFSQKVCMQRFRDLIFEDGRSG